ncbi:MAG: hypothetical protein J6M24_06170 [Lachnospiraceae bacterium]|nr:hypothetical protein [Lachnospiraceae bacterium]
MKEKKSIIFITIYFLLLLLPAVSMPFFKNAGNSEKRELAKAPKLFEDGKLNTGFGNDVDAYISDHIGFRNMLVSFENSIKAAVFKESGVERVILGDDGWLYYAEDLNDYLNIPTISRRNAANIARTYKMVQEQLEKEGRSFLFTVVPNKSSLYDRLPYYYVPLKGKGNIELLSEAFKSEGVRYADLYGAFKENSEVLYLKTDTHWTYKGALFGFNVMMEAAGFEHEDFSGESFTERKDHVGDLAEMLYMDKAEKDVQSYCDREFEFGYTSHEKKPDSLLLTAHNDKGRKNTLYFRDSYFDTLHVFAAESAKNSVFSRKVPYEISYAAKYDADLTVIEIVERNIINLAERAPKAEAPEAVLDISASPADEGLVRLETEEEGEFVHFYGEVDGELIGSGQYRVFLLLSDTEKSTAYEAFPIFEKELMGTKETKDNGFSAYIPYEKSKGKSISVIVQTESGNYIYEKAIEK